MRKPYNKALIPLGLVDILNKEIKSIWETGPSWQWGRKPFEGGMRERLKWKLDTKEVGKSYYRAIIDEELFVLAIAADLFTYENYIYGKVDNSNFKSEIIDYAYKVFQQEGVWKEDGSWLFQPGVWAHHPDYAYSGNNEKTNDIKPCLIEDIASDSSHSHRLPLWINSFIGAYDTDTFDRSKRDYFFKIKNGLEKQFYENVVVKPDGKFNGYRTNNFMDGRNGIYRWNYPTQGQGN